MATNIEIRNIIVGSWGWGIWDMLKANYDPQNKQSDIFKYARRMAIIL